MDDIATEDKITVTVNLNEQGLVYFPGDGLALFLPDDMGRDALLDYVSQPVQRAVLAARLRVFADMLDQSPLDGLLASRTAAQA